MAESMESLRVLAEKFARLEGVGKKTAMRMAFSVLEWDEEEAREFAQAIVDAKEKIHLCPICQNLTDRELCPICIDEDRDRSVICVVTDARAVLAMEKVREFRGVYHVLHGLISPLNGVTPDQLKIKELLTRVAEGEVEEVIVATNPTVEGEATAMYLSKLLRPFEIRVTRLAYGVPVGADLEYADEITLFRALEGRRDV
ncbi:MAG: recombination protein RecR [Clostridia bacterium]|nr:recombination protein RecR [Clostridia bacterium]